ncbi:Gp37 family protein [Foetidibacter luteolus]|uniref:Gp37 family protein n=1 Tax=Foetidibacter luteolus TaxID=2608880 RepID=UPI00129B7C29|nr:Gp37 family protein [Foetidibacter luteolus]
MNYEVAELEIAARINEKLIAAGLQGSFVAVAIPDTEKAAQDVEKDIERGRVIVEHVDSTFDPDQGTDVSIVSERVKFRLSFLARSLRGPVSVYKLVELCKLYLVGFKLSNSERLVPVKHGRQQVEENQYQVYLEFECKTLNVQVDETPEPAIGGPLSGISWEEQFNN